MACKGSTWGLKVCLHLPHIGIVTGGIYGGNEKK